MPPKKATTDKNKDTLIEIEEAESNQVDQLEEELRELQRKLAVADEEISETKLQAVNERKRLTDMLLQQEEVTKLEKETIERSYRQKMADMCREKDSVINDMQDRVRVYQEMQENIQREGERRVHYRDDDTIILPQASSSAHSYINGFDAENNRTPQMTPNQRNVPVLMRRPTLTKFDVPLPRQLVYDGKMSWDSFIKPFLSNAVSCGWTEDDKLFRLTSSLRGEAAEYAFNQLSHEITGSFSALQRALESRFKERRTSASYLNELENRKFSSKEKLLEYAADIKRLVIKGYPTADELTRETINVRYFLKGLSDQQLAIAVGMKDPKTIDDAREMVETYNSLRDDVGRGQRIRSVNVDVGSDKGRANQRRPQKQEAKNGDRCVTTEDVKRLIDQKLQQERTERAGTTEKQYIPNYAKRRVFPDKKHIECYKCHKLGHYANECMNVTDSSSTNTKDTKENAEN